MTIASMTPSNGRSAVSTPELATPDQVEHDDNRLVPAGMNPVVRDAFEVSGFDRMLQIEPDLEAGRAKHA